MPQIKPATVGGNKIEARPINKPFIIAPEDMYYNMNHAHRGLALILNHKYYDDKDMPVRYGTERDKDALQRVLTNLGFKVVVKNDLNFEEVYNTIQEVARMDHSQNDCLIISVLTHGDLGMLYAKDTHYGLDILWREFTAKRCPTLAGKPKIFFVQACRGAKFDNGIQLNKKVTDDDTTTNQFDSNINTATQMNEESALSRNPTYPDILLALSTVAGYYSWRNSENGSWFIQSLCEKLAERAHDTDILNVLTLVNHKVAVHYESDTVDPSSRNKKEMPNFSSTLTRLLVLSHKTETPVNCCNHA
ncbi:caspase-1-like [Anticarsia gemmatalis]|uniref:caspase-1-like n=1 Tax=Anticarsia gemmatalis TaxID=129554 RepID=UPI003F766265